MSVAPLLHQRLEFGVVPVRKHDAGGDEQVAGTAARFRQPLALEAKGPAARGILRYRQLDGAAQRRHANLAAEHGFIQRNRQIDAQVAGELLPARGAAGGRGPGAPSPPPYSRCGGPAATPAGILTLSSLPVGNRT